MSDEYVIILNINKDGKYKYICIFFFNEIFYLWTELIYEQFYR